MNWKNNEITEEEFVQREHLEEESLRSTFQFFVRHSVRDIGRRKFHYSLAFCSVFIVVLSSLVINTVVEKGPIIFLRLAEYNHGEVDGFVVPFGSYKKEGAYFNHHIFLNYSRVNELYGESEDEELNLSPRKYTYGVSMLVEEQPDDNTETQLLSEDDINH